MSAVTQILQFLVVAALAGLLGAAAMTGTMKMISLTGWARADMVVAVGSLLTKSRSNAFLVGIFLHGISAIVFGMAYTLLLMAVQLTGWPMGFLAGAFFGVFHGLIVSLALCWVVADNHPLEEFRRVTMSVAVTHFLGHVIFGAVVGFVIAVSPL